MATTPLPLNYRSNSPTNLPPSEVDSNFQQLANALAALTDTVAALAQPGGGSGVKNYVDLLDKASVDLTSINNPLASALSNKLAAAHAGTGGAAHALVIAGGNAGFISGGDKLKLDGISNGATANSPDASLLNRANHTGTQLSTTISDFIEACQDVIGAMIAAAGGTYNDPAGTITLPSGGAGGTSALLTGIDTTTKGAVQAIHTILQGIGLLQATKRDDSPAVDVSAVSTLSATTHCDRHLFSINDGVTLRALPATGALGGQFIEYTNGGALPHAFTGATVAPGLVSVCNPGESIQFVMSGGTWYAVSAANPSIVPAAPTHAANYQTVLGDAGKRVAHPVGDEVVRTFSIDGTQPYIDGTVITFPNRTTAALQIALVGPGTLRLAGSALTGPRTVPTHSYCTVMLDAGDWLASGPGVT